MCVCVCVCVCVCEYTHVILGFPCDCDLKSSANLRSVDGSHIQGSSSPTSRVDCLTLKDGTDRLSRNVGNKLPIYTA